MKLFNSKDWQKPGCKQILTQNSLVKSAQQKILNCRKFEFSSYAVAVQLPPQQQSQQDHSFYVVYYIALRGQFLLDQGSLVLIVTSPKGITISLLPSHELPNEMF